MDALRSYMISVLASAIICSIVNRWLGTKGTHGAILKLLTGLFMTITMLSPLIQINLSNTESYFDWITTDADAAVYNGQLIAMESTAEIIKEQTEAYILDKAAFWELNLAVEVTLSESDPPVPISVVLRGNASPYAKNQMSSWIASEIGISEDQQIWK